MSNSSDQFVAHTRASIKKIQGKRPSFSSQETLAKKLLNTIEKDPTTMTLSNWILLLEKYDFSQASIDCSVTYETF